MQHLRGLGSMHPQRCTYRPEPATSTRNDFFGMYQDKSAETEMLVARSRWWRDLQTLWQPIGLKGSLIQTLGRELDFDFTSLLLGHVFIVPVTVTLPALACFEDLQDGSYKQSILHSI